MLWIKMYTIRFFFFFFKQKTAYEMRISDWSSDVCSSDLQEERCPMPSALDLRLETAYNLITGPGGPIEVGSVERFGRPLPFITNAPTNLADYVAYFCTLHGDATFLVEGDERLSFAQIHAGARKVAAALIDGHGVQRGDRVAIAMQIGSTWCRERVCQYV